MNSYRSAVFGARTQTHVVGNKIRITSDALLQMIRRKYTQPLKLRDSSSAQKQGNC